MGLRGELQSIDVNGNQQLLHRYPGARSAVFPVVSLLPMERSRALMLAGLGPPEIVAGRRSSNRRKRTADACLG